LLPWKTFEVVYSIVAEKITGEGEPKTDWELYERRRNWWQRVHELDTLKVTASGSGTSDSSIDAAR